MALIAEDRLAGSALEAWRSYLRSHATILRELDTELLNEHGMTTRDYEVLLYLAQADGRQLPMSTLAQSTMLTRSGITRLVDGLVQSGLVARAACPEDARIAYACLTPVGYEKLKRAGRTHIRSIQRMFLAPFEEDEVEQLARLLRRLPGADDGASCTVE